MFEFVEELAEKQTLDDAGLRRLLESDDPSLAAFLHHRAREVTESVFGDKVWLRALIEWSNICRNDCLYCGIRRSNKSVVRYVLSHEEILCSCETAYSLGLRTFVLQGGENPRAAAGLAGTIAEMRSSWPDCAITLSLGELPAETYALLRKSGADRYLLRHETADAQHYSRLHPEGMSLNARLGCLQTLRSLGFQTGMGMMVGSPFQTTDNLISDIRMIERFKPEMAGVGPFIPHHGTPFADRPAGSVEMTLKMYSILRLMHPGAMIPSTTALSTLAADGRKKGILAGANVIMPNFTPQLQRAEYSLYDGKDTRRIEARENLKALEAELAAAGRSIGLGRGDYKKTNTHA